ncbi:MAG: DUF1499 domain-containing protein [Leptospiraceae bacterium]|nr:DUF1499 domain-containing protein [Leptospiraceae bacterium]
MKNRFFVLLSFLFSFCTGTRPTDLGVRDGQLKPCPNTPNCVSSFASKDDKTHYIEPITYTSSLQEEMSRLKRVILSKPRTEIIEEKPNYLRAEFTSRIFRFVDDVEFLFDDSIKFIHVRSASRIGRSDLGVNRKRIEEIRSDLQKLRN